MIRCDQCNSATINGVYCHETGCPKSWLDENGEAAPFPCWECGFDFIPEEKPFKHITCSDCQSDHVWNLQHN